MKNLFTLLFVFLSTFSFSQLTWEMDSIDVGIYENMASESIIKMTNSTGVAIQGLGWTTLDNTLDNNWKLQFCDCENCFTNDFGPLPTNATMGADLQDSGSCLWSLKINPNAEPIVNAVYQVQVNDPTNMHSDTILFKVYHNTALGINVIEQADNKSISLFPNPVTTQNLSVVIPSSINISELLITDILGNEIKRVVNPTNSIDVSFLENGYYFVNALNSSKVVSSKSFIVNR